VEDVKNNSFVATDVVSPKYESIYIINWATQSTVNVCYLTQRTAISNASKISPWNMTEILIITLMNGMWIFRTYPLWLWVVLRC